MSAGLKDYSPAEVVVSFNGVPITGYADGSFVKVTWNEPAYNTTVGAGGEVVRTKNANRTGRVEVTLLQTSVSNDVLMAQYKLDRAGLGAGVLLVQDLLGTTSIMAERAWIAELPEVEFGKETTSRVWKFDTGQLELVNIGGNI